MDPFGNPTPSPQQDQSLQGNPFVGSNPMNPSLQEYLRFLQGTLYNSVMQQRAQQAPPGQQKPNNQSMLGPMKWGGPNTIEISKGEIPKQSSPFNIQFNSPSPMEAPQAPKQEENYFDPYAAAAAMNAQSFGFGARGSINTGGYSFGLAPTGNQKQQGQQPPQQQQG